MNLLNLINACLEKSNSNVVEIHQDHAGKISVFTIPSQWVDGDTLEEVFEEVAKFLAGIRCWECENRHGTCRKHRDTNSPMV